MDEKTGIKESSISLVGPDEVIEMGDFKKKCKELKFHKKIIEPSDIQYYRLYGLNNIPNIPDPGQDVYVVDCKTGKEYKTHMFDHQNGLISANLTELWREDNRHRKLKVGDQIGIALDPENNHRIYVCFEYQEKVKSINIETEEVGKEKIDPDKEENIQITRYLDRDIDDAKEIIQIIEKFIPEDIREEINGLDGVHKYEILKSVAKGISTKVVADKEIRQKAKEKEINEKEQKRKEQEINEKTRQREEKLSDTSNIGRLLLDAKIVSLYGPTGTRKTTRAMTIAGEIVATCIEGKTDNLFIEFKNKGYIIFQRAHPGYDYGRFIERKTVYTEKEGKPSERSYISLPGDVKIASTIALALAIGMNIEDIINKHWKDDNYKTWNDIFHIYEERTMMMVQKEKREKIFKYAPKIVLILDEVNRGYVQEIFGEFGTMMERDKRLGEEFEVTVPLKSGDLFGIPPNLYIIFTMNITDANIVGMDISTLRRFDSLPCMPELHIVTEYIEGAYEKRLISDNDRRVLLKSVEALEKLNDRICNDEELGQYMQLGEGYFLDMEEESRLANGGKLIMRWNNKILPTIEVICRYNADKINEILFKETSKKGIQQFENISDLERFIDDIIRAD